MDGAEHVVTDEQFSIIVGLLVDIRDGIVALCAQPEQSDDCPHPEEQRISLSTPADPNHWVCNACRFDNKAPEHTMN